MRKSEGTHPPLFSPLSIFLAVIAVIIIAAFFVFNGSSMFSPGPLSSQNTRGLSIAGYTSHANFEDQCNLCHRPLTSSQNETCLECHQDIGEQIKRTSGLHGRIKNISSCRECHSDHKGRNFDMIQSALNNFDHNLTSFPLSGKHLSLTCQDCHKTDFKITQAACINCHEEPMVHAGLFPQDCKQCHTTTTWKPALWLEQEFDHAKTDFSLIRHLQDFQGLPITCQSCHQSISANVDTNRCKDCHLTHQSADFIDQHVQTFGMDCTGCHDGTDRMESFDHQKVFPLEGKHAAIECQNCHINQQFHGTSNQCSSCHSEPEIHAGSFGLQCAACHDAQAWQPAFLRIHPFPLDHGAQADNACTVCHTQTYATYTCEACHDVAENGFIEAHNQAKIPQDQLNNCTACHLDGAIQ